MSYFTAAQVVKKISNPNIALYKGDGYWYFIYDDKGELYGSHSVYTMYLNSMSLDHWVQLGKRFATYMEANGSQIGFY